MDMKSLHHVKCFSAPCSFLRYSLVIEATGRQKVVYGKAFTQQQPVRSLPRIY